MYEKICIKCNLKIVLFIDFLRSIYIIFFVNVNNVVNNIIVVDK